MYKDRGLVIDKVESEGADVGEFAVAELDKNICELGMEVGEEGRVEGRKIAVREAITRDVRDQHEC